MKTDVKSLKVEIKGPLATAGSNPNFTITFGIKEPAKLATTIAEAIATPIMIPRKRLPFHILATKAITIPTTRPVATPVRSSNQKEAKKASSSDLFVNLRIATAKDWVPAFPAVPVINVTKLDSTGAVERSPSNWLIREAVPIPRKRRVTSQGKRLLEA